MNNGGVDANGFPITPTATNTDFANTRAGLPQSGPNSANPGVAPYDPGPEVPVAAPPGIANGSPSTEGLQEVVLDAMKTAQQATYAQRWLQHKLYWVNQLDPRNSPYLQVTAPRIGPPLITPHPWTTP